MTKRENCFVNFVTKPTVILIAFFLIGFILHPKWMNLRLYLGDTERNVPLNFVSNFYLWTRYNRKVAERLVLRPRQELLPSNLRARKTYILIHGFTRSGLESWIIRMKDDLLWREDCNVISVDWEAGSLTAGYYVIQDRVPLVGEDVSKLVGALRKQNDLEGYEIHIIGHSLGSHVAGFAGKFLNGTLERITGLDPAGLGYYGVSPKDRLDKSDAAFVDVIHTHGCYTIINQWTDCFGTYETLGHADFWPNGGEHQPACEEDGDGVFNVRAEGSNCDHGMAYVYFLESIRYYKTSTRYLARECQSYSHFNNGSCECSKTPQYLGYNVNPSLHGMFYLNTSKTAVYGLLDPECSPAEYSFVKVFGLIVCSLLVLFGFVYLFLVLVSHVLKKDLIEELKSKYHPFNLSKKSK